MIAKYLVPAFAAISSVAAASSSACSTATTTINSQADATALATSCQTFTGDVLVSPDYSGAVSFDGLRSIKGNFIAQNDLYLNSISSNSLNSISGEFKLSNLTQLVNLKFDDLSSVGSISWQALTSLDSLGFTTGLTTAKSIVISDTFLSTLEGIAVTSLTDLDLNNNQRLAVWNSTLHNLSNTLNFLANGINGGKFDVTFNSLTWIANMTISNTTSLAFPALQTVNGSASFTSNQLTEFNAPNLTSTQSGNLNFIGNNALKNITVPKLTSIGGALLIANNTALDTINGFGNLKTVGGAVKLRGNFSDVDFPSLNDVKGAFDISSTNDISAACDKFQKLAPSKQGGNGDIQGVYHCESNNAQANSDTGGNTSTSGTTGGGSGSGSSGTKGNSAAGVVANAAMLGLAVVGGLVALL